MSVADRIKRSVARRSANVFLRTDFKKFGSQAQVTRALRQLQSADVLVKLGVGVYARSKRSVVSGEPIPVKPLEVLAPEILTMLGVQVGPSRLTQEYNSGASSQIPPGIVLNTGNRRITRKLGFNGKLVNYER